MRWILLLCLSWPALADTVTLEEYLERPEAFGNVVLLRHALAPGGGDPANFDLADCSTQRNLSEQGRQQSIDLGISLAAGDFDQVYSSPWCRCMETAELMGLGPVTSHMGLASFFQGHVDRQDTLTQLDQLLYENTQQSKLLVTHFVVISALTGRGVGSGEAVVYNPATKDSWRLIISP